MPHSRDVVPLCAFAGAAALTGFSFWRAWHSASVGRRHATTKASASGKVLIVGGYLITERPNVGFAMAVSARIHSSISPCLTTINQSLCDDVGHSSSLEVCVISPQFNSSWEYLIALRDEEDGRRIELRSNDPDTVVEEGFITSALLSSFSLVSSMAPEQLRHSLGTRIELTIKGDDAFYSTKADEHTPPKKTGLGSSAALVTSITGAVLHHFSPESPDTELIHNLSQYSHFLAQGKIGSGFDVSAAVFGSQVYTRFDPSVLSGVPTHSLVGDDGALLSRQSADQLYALMKSDLWNGTQEYQDLPRGMILMLGDVKEGSSTPGMVRKVKAWLKSIRESGDYDGSPWANLVEHNEEFIDKIRTLKEIALADGKEYDECLSWCSRSSPEEWGDHSKTGKVLIEARNVFLEIRKNLKAMGVGCGADIEPDCQTDLLDVTMSIPGVLAAGVPGAGGMDAVFAIALSKDVELNVRQCWESRGVVPLELCEGKSGITLEKHN